MTPITSEQQRALLDGESYDEALLRDEVHTALQMLALSLDGMRRIEAELRRSAESQTEAASEYPWQHHLACGRAEGLGHAATMIAALHNAVMERGSAYERP